MNEHLTQDGRCLCELSALLVFVCEKSSPEDNKAIRLGCVAGREYWDNGVGWRETGTRSTQKENWSITDAFSTYFLNLEGVNILYSKGFDIVPFFWEVRENKFF